MELSAENVVATVKKCLPESVNQEEEKLLMNGEAPEGFVLAEGVRSRFAFRKSAVEQVREDVKSMLAQLPENFMKGKGGGWSFLQACMNKDEVQWGEHRNIDDLICLGSALGMVKFCMPREMWRALPGGMPYFVVDLEGKG